MTDILRLLERDFEAAHKQSVKECLRSKKIPSPEVAAFMQKQTNNKIQLQDLKMAYTSVLTEYLGPLSAQSQPTTQLSTLAAASKIGTAIRFTQLTLEALHQSKHDDFCGEYLKLASQTLQGMADACASRVEQAAASSRNQTHVNMDEVYGGKATENFCPYAVTCYGIGALLPLHHYIHTRPQFLSILWKTLTQLIQLLQQRQQNPLPSELANDIVLALLPFLRDGLDAMMQNVRAWLLQGAPVQPHNGKILLFLVSRLKLVVQPTSSTGLSILLALQGSQGALEAMVVDHGGNNTKELQAYLAASKSARSTLAALSLPIDHIISLEVVKSSERLFYWGQSQLLIECLETAAAKGTHSITLSQADSLLKACRHLLFLALPLSDSRLLSQTTTGREMVAKACRIVATTLSRCERRTPAIACNATPGRAQYHRAVVSWLMAPGYFSQELVLSSISLYIQVSTTDSSIVPLLCQLLVDKRTHCRFRNMIVRLFEIISAMNNGMAIRTARSAIQPFLDQTSMQLGKRKRETSTIQDLHVSTVSCIGRVAALLSERSSLKMFHHCVSDESSLRRRMMPAVILELLNCSTSEELKLISITDSTTALLKRRMTWFDDKVFVHFVAALLDATGKAMKYNHEKTSSNMIDSVFALLGLVLSRPPSTQNLFRLHLACAKFAGKLSNIFHVSADSKLIGQVSDVFQKLLVSNEWVVRSSALTELIAFATGLPAAQKGVLRSCLPNTMVEALQRRVNKTIQKKTYSLYDGSRGWYDAMAKRLLSSPESELGMILSQKSSIMISVGSFITRMPTQDGREALVVFPPGKQSLDDMQMMAQGEELVVQRVHGTMLSSNGECKIELRSI